MFHAGPFGRGGAVVPISPPAGVLLAPLIPFGNIFYLHALPAPVMPCQSAHPMSREIRVLTIESTCDETAAAVIDGDLRVLSSVVASQEGLHQQFRGVVPEIAARAHMQRMLPVIDEVLRQAAIHGPELSAIGIANTPGLAGSLLVGLMAAKSLAFAWDVPLVSINHLHAHIYACRMAAGRDVFPCVGLIASGGHSHLYHCRNAFEYEHLGGTIDDAAGEAFDKVASMLSLPYPGGPSLSRAAERGDARKYAFPRSFIDEPRLDFSFSGLKTAVRYTVAGQGKQDFSNLQLAPQLVADVAASFEQAVVDCLVAKSLAACRQTGLQRLCVGGGVAANRVLRRDLQAAADEQQVEIVIAPPELCTDNAVMGGIAIEKVRAGEFVELDLDIIPGLVRN